MAAAFAKSRRGDGAGLRPALRQFGTKFPGKPDRRPDRRVRGRVNELLIGGQMSTETLFRTHLVLDSVAWLLCFGAYVWPWLRSMGGSQRIAPLLPTQLPLFRARILPSGCCKSQPARGIR